jgi:hypothetical protein
VSKDIARMQAKAPQLNNGGMAAADYDVSPPSKKLRTADFSTIVRRSHSITENSIDMGKSVTEKVINDRYRAFNLKFYVCLFVFTRPGGTHDRCFQPVTRFLPSLGQNPPVP